MKPSQTDLLEWIAIRNRPQCFYTIQSSGHELSKKDFLSAIELSSSLKREYFNPFFSPSPCFFFSIKGEPGRNGNSGEVGFAGSPVSLYLPI